MFDEIQCSRLLILIVCVNPVKEHVAINRPWGVPSRGSPQYVSMLTQLSNKKCSDDTDENRSDNNDDHDNNRSDNSKSSKDVSRLTVLCARHIGVAVHVHFLWSVAVDVVVPDSSGSAACSASVVSSASSASSSATPQPVLLHLMFIMPKNVLNCYHEQHQDILYLVKIKFVLFIQTAT